MNYALAADKVWAQIVKLRAGYKCEWCPNPATDAHHMLGKGNAVRFHLENGVALCRECHNYFHFTSRATGTALFKKYRHDDWLKIEPLEHTVVHLMGFQEREIYQHLKKILREELRKAA